MSSRSSRPRLVLPCVALGLVAGQKVALLLRHRQLRRPFYYLLEEAHHGLVLVAIAACGGLVAGLAMEMGPRLRPGETARWNLAMILGACIGCGMLVRLSTGMRSIYTAQDDMMGAIQFGAALLPVLIALLLAIGRVGRARTGSLVDLSDRRAVWLPVATAAALSPLVDVIFEWNDPWEYSSPPCTPFAVSRALGALGLLAVAALVIADRRALVEGQRAAERARKMERAKPDSPGLVGTPLLLDFGLGGGVAVDPLPPAGYRGGDQYRRAVVGDPALALPALGRAIRLGAAALVMGAVQLVAVWGGPQGECAAPWDAAGERR